MMRLRTFILRDIRGQVRAAMFALGVMLLFAVAVASRTKPQTSSVNDRAKHDLSIRYALADLYYPGYLEIMAMWDSLAYLSGDSSLKRVSKKEYALETVVYEGQLATPDSLVILHRYDIVSIRELPNIVAETADSFRVVRSAGLGGAPKEKRLDIGEYIQLVDSLYFPWRRRTFEASDAVEAVKLAIEFAWLIERGSMPRVLNDWRDIFSDDGHLEIDEDTINVQGDPVLRAVSPPSCESVNNGYVVTVYWQVNSAIIFKSEIYRDPDHIVLRNNRELGRRGSIRVKI